MLKEFKNIKQIIVVIVILLVYCIAVGIFISSRHKDEKSNNNSNNSSQNQKADSNELDMIMTPNTIISVTDDKWEENSDLDYSDIKFNVYTDKEYKDSYVTYTDEWYIMDSGRSSIDFDTKIGFTAISSKTNALFNYLQDSFSDADKEVVNAYLESKDVKFLCVC